MVDDGAHYAVAGLEGGHFGADGDDGAGAFVGSGDGEGRPHAASLDHEVGVAEGGDGDADEEVFWGEVGRDGDGVDLERLVVLWVVISRGAVCGLEGWTYGKGWVCVICIGI